MLIIIIRTLVLYVLVIFALRLMGKKQLGELQPSELVTTILVSNIATLSIEDASMPMLPGLVPIFIIVGLDVTVSYIMLKSGKVRRFIAGTPQVIISDGKILQKEMRRLRYTIDDVMEAMRDNQIFDISSVRYAVVETTGKINFFRKYETEKNPPSVIIKDGELCEGGLSEHRLDKAWLENLLKRRKTKLSEVFLLTADDDGEVCFVRKRND